MKISVVVTNLNNYHELWFTLQHNIIELEASGLEAWEIIVADNGSETGEMDMVTTMIKNFAKCYPVRLIVYDKRKTCAGIRTAGLLEAKYDPICFMDGHVLVKHGYFRETPQLLDDDTYVIFAPEAYFAEKLYEYHLGHQWRFEQSTATFEPVSDQPYPVLAACQACTLVRRDITKLFFPQDELDYISYTMDEPYTSMLPWLFGKRTLMDPRTYYAHRPWSYTRGGHWDYESWRPLGAYALAGPDGFARSMTFWHSDQQLILPEKHRQFILKNAKIDYHDLPAYLASQGVKR